MNAETGNIHQKPRETSRQSLPLDAAAADSLNGGPSFPLRNRLLRALWIPVWFLLASWTPRGLRFWRVFLLRVFGAEIGSGADVRGRAHVWYPPHLVMEANAIIAERVICYNMAPIVLRRGALISQGAHLCAGSHDIDDPRFQLVTHPIDIGRGAWVAAEAFVGPGVTLGEGAVVGARAVVMSDVSAYAIAVGSPAKELARRRKAICEKAAGE